MTDKEFRRLRRIDLIDIIYELQKEQAELQKENEELKRQLAEKRLKAARAGSLAELSASLNGLFEAAQATADQYLAGVRDAAGGAPPGEPDPEGRAEPAEAGSYGG